MVLPWTNAVAKVTRACSCGDRWVVSIHLAKMSATATYHVVSFEFSPPTEEEIMEQNRKEMP